MIGTRWLLAIISSSTSQVLVTDHELVGKVDRESLAGVEIALVEESRDAVHLDQVLDVLFSTQPI